VQHSLSVHSTPKGHCAARSVSTLHPKRPLYSTVCQYTPPQKATVQHSLSVHSTSKGHCAAQPVSTLHLKRPLCSTVCQYTPPQKTTVQHSLSVHSTPKRPLCSTVCQYTPPQISVNATRLIITGLYNRDAAEGSLDISVSI